MPVPRSAEHGARTLLLPPQGGAVLSGGSWKRSCNMQPSPFVKDDRESIPSLPPRALPPSLVNNDLLVPGLEFGVQV